MYLCYLTFCIFLLFITIMFVKSYLNGDIVLLVSISQCVVRYCCYVTSIFFILRILINFEPDIESLGQQCSRCISNIS